jgi:hypothetical protein
MRFYGPFCIILCLFAKYKYQAAILVTRLSLKAAVQVKDSVVKRIDDEMQKAAATKKGIPIDVDVGESGGEGDKSPAGGDTSKDTEEENVETFGEQDVGKLASC